MSEASSFGRFVVDMGASCAGWRFWGYGSVEDSRERCYKNEQKGGIFIVMLVMIAIDV
jgi:hypothetical protein